MTTTPPPSSGDEAGGPSPAELIAQARGALAAALIGPSPARRRLYQESPHFHQAIDLLVDLLPAWVGGLAAQAEAADEELAKRQRLAKLAGPNLTPAQIADLNRDLRHVRVFTEGQG